MSVLLSLSSHPPDGADASFVKLQAHTLFQELELDANLEALPFSYPSEYRLPLPRSSLILKDIRDNPGIDLILDRLRRERWDGYSRQAVYIELLSKPTLYATDDTLSPLKERIDDFLNSKSEVMLILSDTGAGKSTFIKRLEHDLWGKYKAGDPIPLFIDLKTIARPDEDMVRKQLAYYKFSEEQIDEMRKSRHFTLICDGYDECGKWTNLHTNNGLNQSMQWRAKMIVTCRTQYLIPTYRGYFQVQTGRDADLIQEAVIVSFNTEQIKVHSSTRSNLRETRLFWLGDNLVCRKVSGEIQYDPSFVGVGQESVHAPNDLGYPAQNLSNDDQVDSGAAIRRVCGNVL